jgi:hypothetical protein
MTGKVGRNDPCPCGSGKKHKHCCMTRGVKSRGLPWPVSDESHAIGTLLQSSAEFAAYYHAERYNIQGEVLWARDTSLPAGIDYRNTMVGPGVHVVRLRRLPAVLSDAMKIAHELHHLVLDSAGFPRTGAPPASEILSSSLNSMVHDPLVNSALRVYGFDPLDDYQTELRETLRQLRKRRRAPTQHTDRVHWILNYVGKALDWKEISAHTDGGADMFRLWFDKRYPDLARDARELLEVVETIGYDTPARQRTLFKTIIRRYGLESWVFI